MEAVLSLISPPMMIPIRPRAGVGVCTTEWPHDTHGTPLAPFATMPLVCGYFSSSLCPSIYLTHSPRSLFPALISKVYASPLCPWLRIEVATRSKHLHELAPANYETRKLKSHMVEGTYLRHVPEAWPYRRHTSHSGVRVRFGRKNENLCCHAFRRND